MSRSKTEIDNNEVVDESKAVETKVVNAATQTSVSNTKKGKRMGVEIYLQKHPQSYEIATLLRAKYKTAIMTEEEWNDVVEKLLAKLIIS